MKLVLLCLAATALSVAAQSDAPIGPLTTNNAQSACVQYGDCTALPAGNTAATATQYSPVTPPASTAATAAPTNAAESAASLSALAAGGASSAFTGKNSANSGLQSSSSVRLTGNVITAPTTASSAGSSGGASANAASPPLITSHSGWALAVLPALAAILGGALVVA